MASTSISIQSWVDVPKAEHVKLCRLIQAASGEGGLVRSNVGYQIADLNAIYTYAQGDKPTIESRLALSLKPMTVRWTKFDPAMILVLAHMLALSHSYPECRFDVDSEPDHEQYLEQAYTIARSAIPALRRPTWLGGPQVQSLEDIDRPDWLDFRS